MLRMPSHSFAPRADPNLKPALSCSNCLCEEYRKQHLGARLLEELLKKAEELGARELHIGAQVQAQGFYEKFGFHTCGEPVYMDVHIPHVDMVRHLSGEA